MLTDFTVVLRGLIFNAEDDSGHQCTKHSISTACSSNNNLQSANNVTQTYRKTYFPSFCVGDDTKQTFQDKNENYPTRRCLKLSVFQEISFKNLSLLVLHCVVLMSLPIATTGQHAVRHHTVIEPSKAVIASLDDGGFQRHNSQLLENFRQRRDEPDWSFDESCEFVAAVGHMFNQSLMKKLRQKYPDLPTKTEIKVHIPESLHNDWLMFNETQFLLQGVPLRRHLGVLYNFMVTISVQGSIIHSTPCQIDVVNNEGSSTFQSVSADEHLHWEPVLTKIGCLPTESVVTMVIQLDAKEKDLSAENRFRLLEKLALFMTPLKEFQRNSIFMETGSDITYNAFLSGDGNIADTKKRQSEVALCWSFGCGNDIEIKLTGLDFVEKTAKNGTLATSIGYDVIQWSVRNRKPISNKFYTTKRHKRHLNSRRYKSPGKSPRASQLDHPGFDPNLNNLKNPYNIAGSNVIDVDSNISPPPGTRKVPNHRILRSPTVFAPKATPLPTRSVRLPKTPSVTDVMNLEFSTRSDTDQPPEINNGIEDITVHCYTYFEYHIPKNTFSDNEDGDTRSLSLSIMPINKKGNLSNQSNERPWLMLDAATQTLYGVSPKQRKKRSYGFLLIGKDKAEMSTTDNFAVHLDEKLRPTNHRITMSFSKYNQALLLPKLTSLFARRLSLALEQDWHETEPPGQLTFVKFDVDGSRLSVTWFDNSLGDNERCDMENIQALLSKMVDTTARVSNNQRFSPKYDFKAQFQPNFTLKTIKVSFFGPCSLKTSATEQPAFPQPPLIPPRRPYSPTITSLATPLTTTTEPLTKSMDSAKSETLYPYGPPFVFEPDYVWRISSEVGKMNMDRVFVFLFGGGPTGSDDPKDKLKLKLVATDYGLPSWIGTNEELAILTLPSLHDYDSLQVLNTTHRLWKGAIVAVDGYGRMSERVPVNVVVSLPSDYNNMLSEFTHLFQMTITNYAIQNFTVRDSARVLDVIRKTSGDPNSQQIYVYPLKVGSVVFSWSNDTITAANDDCPSNKIKDMRSRFLYDNNTLKASARQRFSAAGFDVRNINLKQMNQCLKVYSTSRQTQPTTAVTSLPVKSPITTTEKDTKTNPDSNVLQVAGNKLTGIVIIVVILICILALLIVTVIFCRRNSAAKRKEKQKMKSDPATASPFHVEGHEKNGDSNLERKLHLKSASPVIFAGEARNRHEDTLLLHHQQTNFIENQASSPINKGVQENIQNESESLLKNPSHKFDDDRPVPPPYDADLHNKV